MKITTESGTVSVNKKTPYGKWLIGYMSTGAWSGWYTIERTWNSQKDNKPIGCSWKAWGVICGKITKNYRSLFAEINELNKKCGRL